MIVIVSAWPDEAVDDVLSMYFQKNEAVPDQQYWVQAVVVHHHLGQGYAATLTTRAESHTVSA